MTVRDKAALDALFADTGRIITPQDVRDLIESERVGFHIWCDGLAEAQAVGTAWVQCNQFNQQGLKRGWTFGAGIKAICSAGAGGIYAYWLALGLAGDAGQYDASLFKLPTTEIESSRTRIAGLANSSMCGLVQITDGAEIVMGFRKTTTTGNVLLARGTSMLFVRME